MTTGVAFPTVTLLPLTDATGDHILPLGAWDGLISIPPAAGTFSNTQPVEGRSLPLAGGRAATFFDDYYNRVHVIPAAIDFGTIGSSTSRNVVLWNARLTSVTMANISQDDSSQGVTLSGATPPYVMSPLGTKTYSVAASANGSSDIAVNFGFNFTNGEAPVLPVVGVRSKLWPFAPNWRDSYSIGYEFRTDIFTSRSGKEQRRAQRSQPRRVIEFTVSRGFDEMRSVTRFLSKWQASDMVVPDLLRTAVSSDGMPLAGHQIEVTSVPDWLVEGQTIILSAGDTYAQRTVVGITDTLIDFGFDSPESWPAGTKLHPALTSALANDVTVKNPTSEVAEAAISFKVRPGVNLADPEGSPVNAFNGRELLPFSPNWQNGITGSFVQQTDIVDFGHGRIQTVRPITFSTRLQQMGYIFGSQAEADSMVKFFTRMRGQRGEFYMDSGINDVVLMDDVAYGVKLLRIEGLEFYDTYSGDTVNKALMFYTSEGIYPRRITNITTSGENTIVELAIGLPLALTPATVIRISWLTATRFATDLLTLEAVTDGVGRTQMSTRTLEDLDANDPVWAGLDEGAQWFLDFYGWPLADSISNPIHQWVHVEYPKIGGTWRMDDAAWYLNKYFGLDFINTEIEQPLHEWVHDFYPTI